MGGDLSTALLTAQSGLLSNQQALNTVANNVANVYTEGYSRKITSFQSVTLSGIGSGVKISEMIYIFTGIVICQVELKKCKNAKFSKIVSF